MSNAQHFWIGQARGEHYAIWENEHLILCFEGTKEVVCHRDQLTVKTHPDNILFAVAIAKLHYVPMSTLVEQLQAFKGVEHRLEYVRTVGDVHFYNDSSSTSPDSALTAIDQFVPDRLILMLGGSSKNADFDTLADVIVKKHVRVVLYGAEGQPIKERLLAHEGAALILEHFKDGNFEGIVRQTFELAKPEDNVVMSPACASFDLFKNAKERGKEFKRVVALL
ncbi:hypothetical protein IPJ72_07220 [Candidatus Peregrinibacteria bacterium]|nr:MAG: hypothetical protein IPJ72_07220 [Candidatus Peregrinibacteria bacterium]